MYLTRGHQVFGTAGYVDSSLHRILLAAKRFGVHIVSMFRVVQYATQHTNRSKLHASLLGLLFDSEDRCAMFRNAAISWQIQSERTYINYWLREVLRSKAVRLQ
jgi:hypothetical protein